MRAEGWEVPDPSFLGIPGAGLQWWQGELLGDLQTSLS